MAFDIDDLQIKITANTSGAQRAIGNLAKKVEALNAAGQNTKGLSNIASRLKDIAVEGDRLNKVARSISEITRALNKVDLDKATTNMSFAERMKGIVETSGSAEDAISGVADKAEDLGKSMATAGKETEKASDNVEDAGKKAEDAGKKFDGAANGGLANFFRMVKRIAMMRAIRSAIKFLAQAVREGFEMFVTWDREQNNYMAGTAANVEKLSEKWTMLKGQIGALGGALANSLIPVINIIIEGLTKLVDLLQAVVRSLQGEYTIYKLVYKTAKATTGQAKELRRVLFGFDELNILPSQSGGGASSSGGTWSYEEVPITSKFLNDLADASNLLFGNWTGGQKVIGGLVGALGILAGAKGFGSILKLLPRLISGFKDKNTQLGKQSEATQTETGKVTSLATAFGLALGGATLFSKFLKENPFNVNVTKPALDFSSDMTAIEQMKQFTEKNPVELKFNTAADLTALSQLATSAISLSAWAASNPIIMSISAPFSQITSAFASLFNTLQRFFNTNPIRIPVAVAGGGLKGAGSYVSGLSSPVANTTRVTAADVEAEIQNAMLTYESDLWNTGGKLGKAVAVLGGSALITAITGGLASVFSGGALGQLFNLLGIAGAFAGGGEIPNTGSLFYAGEAGAEVVANMGHSTGVMNMSQMQEAVASGNVEVVNAVYAMANMVASAINNKDFDVYMDTQKVGQSVSKYQFNQARRGITQGGY